MRDYQNKINFDEIEPKVEPEDLEAAKDKALRIAAAASHLAEVYLWIWGKEGSRSRYRYARFVTIATMIGKMTPR